MNGLEIYTDTGALALSLTDTAYSFIGILDVAPGTSGSQDYPDLAGWTIHVAQIQDASTGANYSDLIHFTSLDVDLTYPAGVPTVSWTAHATLGTGQTVRLMVMAH